MIYRFEGFVLDAARFELRNAEETRPLPQRSFDLLRYLLEHAGRVVTKEEIFEQFWKDAHVGQAVLAVHVRTIRRALGAQAARILTNVRSRGYMISCPVQRIDRTEMRSHPEAGAMNLAPRRPGRRVLRDPLRALATMNGMLSLAIGLEGLELTKDSVDLLRRSLILES
jgi:DNA-binding winged helix-turn-helix (wHTH) protein